MKHRQAPEKFLVSFSYASEQGERVRAIAEAVERLIGKNTVFLDKWYEWYIAGPNGDTKLQEIYSKRSLMAVLCLSSEYGEKSWTLAEKEAIDDLVMRLRPSRDPRDQQRVLPLQVGDGVPPQIPSTTIRMDGQHRQPAEIAADIVRRLEGIDPEGIEAARRTAAESSRFVYLAAVMPDLDDPNRPINRRKVKAVLENSGWSVLPEVEYRKDEYDERLKEDLNRAKAFVQLRGKYPWPILDFDHLQYDAAVTAGLETLVYRSPDINLQDIESESHRTFLDEKNVVCCGFDDFLVHLSKKLEPLALPAAAPRAADDPPLVRVVTRSDKPDDLWAVVFEWLDGEENVLHYHLSPDESLETKHEQEPCQGFLIVCDFAALGDGPLSPKRDLDQCRLIQLREKDRDRRPPVALVYVPPPEPSWARLLRCQPPVLYKAAADPVARQKPPELTDFVRAVRGVPR